MTTAEYWAVAARVGADLLEIYSTSEEPEEIERDRKAVADAVNNAWQDGMSEHDWLRTAAANLGCTPE